MGGKPSCQAEEVNKLKKAIIFLIYFLLLILPLTFWPGLFNQYELPKVIVFRVIIEIALGFYLLLLVTEKNFFIKQNPPFFIASLYILTVFLTSIFGVSWPTSLWGLYFRQEGIFTLIHYFFFFFLVSQSQFLRLKQKTAAWFLVIGAVLTSLVALWQSEVNLNGRLVGTFGEPNFLGGFLVLIFPFSLYLWQDFKKGLFKNLFLGVPFLLVLTIILTGSRSALLATGAVLVISLIFFFKRNWWRWSLVGGLALIFGVLIFQISVNRGFSPNENRLRIWGKAVEAFKMRPILGFGKENFELAFEKVSTEKDIGLLDLRVDRAHNEFLEILVESGVLGLGAYLLLIGLTLRIVIRKICQERDKLFWQAILLSFLTFLIIGQLNVFSAGEYVIFWFLLGLAASDSVPESKIHFLNPDIPKSLLNLGIILIMAFLISLNIRSFLADASFKKGLFEKAVKIYPWEEVYWYKFNEDK